MAGLDRAQKRVERHDGLPGADVALQEPLHGSGVTEVATDLGNRVLLLRRQRERQHGAVAGDQLALARERGCAGLLLQGPPALLEAELEREQLLEGQALAGALGLAAVARPVDGDERVRPQRQALLVADAGGERVGEEAHAGQRRLDEGAEPEAGDFLAGAVLGHEADRVQAGSAHLGAGDLEAAAELARPVQEQLGTGVELCQIGLVEPDRRLPHAGGVDDDALDDLEVAASGRAQTDALERATNGRLLAGRQVAEASHLLPVEVGARDVLGQVAHRAQAEPAEPVRDPGADAGQRRDRRLRVGPAACPGRAGLLAGEPGRGGGYGSPSQ